MKFVMNFDFEISRGGCFNPESHERTESCSNCTAHQCSPLRQKFMECYIIKPAQSLLMKHLVIGQR